MERYDKVEDYIIAYFSEEISMSRARVTALDEKSEKLRAIKRIINKRGLSNVDLNYLLDNIKWSDTF